MNILAVIVNYGTDQLNYLEQAFIKNAIRLYSKQFWKENPLIFQNLQKRMSQDGNYEESALITEMSECMLDPEDDQQIFQLLFKVYYT